VKARSWGAVLPLGMHLDWQTLAVILIELAAVAYLARKFLLPAKPRQKQRPDVAVGSLVRKKR
jgi:hypothetical protein